MSKVAYLDTDFINKTIKAKNNSSTFFDEIIKLPYKFIMVSKVLDEIKNPNILKIIYKYHQEEKISIVDNFEIVKGLKHFFDDITIKHIILDEIRKISIEISKSDTFYKNYFSQLENLCMNETKLKMFIIQLNKIVRNIPSGNNMGEIMTILNISIANRIGDADIFALLSHDSSARQYILNMPNNVKSYDCYSVFYLLKDIISEENAINLGKAWSRAHVKNCNVTINKEGHLKGIDIKDFIKAIYSKNQYHVQQNGLVVFK
ncbi:MAG: hypothetical protein IJB10_00615 [Clostridia bacterium]|nr:hypothetical protein [Clostridia bacterium]